MEQDAKVPKGVDKLVIMISKLEPIEFLGVCEILGIKIYEKNKIRGQRRNVDIIDDYCEYDKEINIESNDDSAPSTDNLNEQARSAEELLSDMIDKLCSLNRNQRRNLTKLLKPAVKGR